jgi:hypothetical protein
VAALCLSLVFVGAQAQARLTHVDGVSDQNLAHWDNAALNVSSFSSGYFANLFRTVWAGGSPASHIRLARFVVPWDVMSDVTGPENEEPGKNGELDFSLFSAWLEDVKWLGLTPVVAVEEAQTEVNGDGAKLPPLVPGSRAEYEQYISGLLSYAASAGEPIAYLEAWNEPNSRGVAHPSAIKAAEFMNAATALCSADGCTPIAGDFLDSEFRPTVERDGGLGVNYEQEYNAGLTSLPVNWGFHPYAALKYEELKHGEETTVARFEKHLPNQSVSLWFTEVGAYFCEDGGGYPSGDQAEREAQQKKNAEYLNLLIDDYYEVAHVFYYEFSNGYGTETECARGPDTSLYNENDEPRQAASVIFEGTTPAPSPPTVVTGAASSLTPTSATLNAEVNPNGGEVSDCHFEYGLTTSFGSGAAPCTTPPGSGNGSVPVSAPAGGLTAGTTYYFRIVATNPGSTSYGAAQVLATPLPTPLAQQGPSEQETLPSQGVLPSQEHKTPPVPNAALASPSLTASSSGTVNVKVSCPAGEISCTGTVTLRTLTAVSASATGHQTKKPNAAILTLAVGAFTVFGGHVTTVMLHLSANARTLLARMRVLHARATIVAHDPTGAAHTTQTAVAIRAAKATHGRKG